jgi:putative NADH-flavin reductase
MGSKVLVIGATGPLGRQVLTQALEKGHVLTAFVRNPDSLSAASERLRVVKGDVTRDDAALRDAMAGQDAVISTLGVGKSFKPGGLIAEGVPRILSAMEEKGVSRLIFVSAFGVGETYRDAPLIPRVFIRLLLRDIYRDKVAGEELIRRSGLDWTIVYPSGLTDAPASGAYRVGERLALRGLPTISRSDVAAFLVKQIEDPTHLKKGVLISA